MFAFGSLETLKAVARRINKETGASADVETDWGYLPRLTVDWKCSKADRSAIGHICSEAGIVLESAPTRRKTNGAVIKL